MNTDRRFFSALIGTFFIALILTQGAFAFEVKGGEKYVLPEDEVINDDLLVAAGEVTIDGIVKGDVLAAGGNIEINGNVDGDIIAAGGNVKISGDTKKSAYIASGNVDISGRVTRNLLLASGTLVMTDESAVGKDALIASGNSEIYGDVAGNLLSSGSDVVIGGDVEGDVDITSDNAPRILSSARIGGDVNYTSANDIIIENNVSVQGTVTKKLPDQRTAFEVFTDKLMGFLSILLVGIIVIRLLPETTRNVCNNMKKSLVLSGVYGIAGLVVVPILAVILMITGVGMPIGLIALAVYITAIYVAKIFASVFIGKYMLSSSGTETSTLGMMLVSGLILFEMAEFMPPLDIVFTSFSLIFAFGAMLITMREMSVNLRKKKMI